MQVVLQANDKAAGLLQQQLSAAQNQLDAVLLDKQKVEIQLSKAEARLELPETILVSHLSVNILPSMHAAWPCLWADHHSL